MPEYGVAEPPAPHEEGWAGFEAGPAAPEYGDSEPADPPAEDWAGFETGPAAPPKVESVFGRARGLARAVQGASLIVWDGAGNSISSGSPAETFFTPGDTEDPAPPLEFGPFPEPLESYPRVPWAPSHVYNGSIIGGDATAIRIPVGPGTRSLTLDLKPGRAGDSFVPRIDQVSLLNRGGELLTQIHGVSFLGDGEFQSLFIAIKGAPIGGEVLVLLAPTFPWEAVPSPDQDPEEAPPYIGGEGGADGEPPAPAPAWEDSYFELNIQRDEFEGFGGSRSSETTVVGETIYAASFGRVELPISIIPRPFKVETAKISETSGPAQRDSVARDQVRREVQVDPAEDGPVEIFLGPLVSRTAAAMGPALATASDEPTPSTDRAARPGADVPPALGSRVDPGAASPAPSRGEAAAQADPPMIALRGPGGVPIVVAGLSAGDRSMEAEAVAASALGAARDVAPPADPARPDEEEPEVARAGIAGRALGFLVGMGLASGPLYPDLLALARRKFRRVPRRVGGRRRVNAGRA
ncbi:hypothetical protein [Paludisphaera sp.]|uniref:hypothetical protein n=1 Tax=Paludisphaera sp. TaxID=2017432 RepID=UPI00301BBF09